MRIRRFFSPAEWEVLEYIVEHHPVSVREVASRFAETHNRARTTTLTLMERLRQKGYLRRRKVKGVYRYTSRQPKSELMHGLVRDFVQSALGGSVSPFMAYLAKEARLTREELLHLKRLVSKLEEGES